MDFLGEGGGEGGVEVGGAGAGGLAGGWGGGGGRGGRGRLPVEGEDSGDGEYLEGRAILGVGGPAGGVGGLCSHLFAEGGDVAGCFYDPLAAVVVLVEFVAEGFEHWEEGRWLRWCVHVVVTMCVFAACHCWLGWGRNGGGHWHKYLFTALAQPHDRTLEFASFGV